MGKRNQQQQQWFSRAQIDELFSGKQPGHAVTNREMKELLVNLFDVEPTTEQEEESEAQPD